MKIVILNGNPDEQNTLFDHYLGNLCKSLEETGHQVQHLKLREKKLHYCTGCWGCWVKTPGECVIPDDSQAISASVIHSDLVLMASPIIMGFISELLKRITDRLIPLLLPHVILVGEECHHKKRYDRYPLLGLLLQKEDDTDAEDIEIITEIYRRMSINLHSRIQSVSFIDMPVEEVCHEIGHI